MGAERAPAGSVPLQPQLVKGDDYLRKLSRYVHLNPVRTKEWESCSITQKTQYLRAYRWSSFRGYIDSKKRNELVEYEPLLGLGNEPRSSRPKEYERFVTAGLTETDEEATLSNRIHREYTWAIRQ